MGTYNADFRVTYQSELQSRPPVDQAAAEQMPAGQTPASAAPSSNAPSSTTLGAVYGGTILGQDANAERRNG